MLTTFRLFNEKDEAIHEGPAVLKLKQDRLGLSVVSEVKFEAKSHVTITRFEIDFGNRTWVQPLKPVTLQPTDSFVWSVVNRLIDTE